MCILSVSRQSCSGDHLIDHHLYVYEPQKVHLKIFKAIVFIAIVLLYPVYRISAPSSSFSQFSSSPSMETRWSRGWSLKEINRKLTVVVVVFVFDHSVVFVLFWWSRGCWSSQAISRKLTVVVFAPLSDNYTRLSNWSQLNKELSD